MRKLILSLFIINFSLFIGAAIAAEYRAAIVADMDTGRVLYSENANDANYPASLTKIMTVYLTFDALEHGRLHLDDHLIVSAAAAGASPVKLGLGAGSKIRVEDAIKAVIVLSANDVARVLAENLKGGKEGNFASLMTRVATEIGLSNTNFENSSGLPDDDHMSTARDIALMSMAVYKHFPKYWKYFGIKSWTYNGKTYNNGNRLLGAYPGCDGMKTGYTNKSKYSLVATANRDGRHVMSVVLGAQNKDVRSAVSIKMLDKGFAALGIDTNNQSLDSGKTEQSSKNLDNNQDLKHLNSKLSAGGSGVQFGAFSSRNAAANHQLKVEKKLGINTVVEVAPNGMFRVRANGLSNTAAQKVKADAIAAGIDSFVYQR